MDAHRSDAMNGDAIDRELQALLAVEPSADFAARVRAHVEEEAARSRWPAWPQLAVVAGGIAVVLLGAVLMFPSADDTPAIAHAPVAVPSSAPTVVARDERQVPTPAAMSRREHVKRAVVRDEPEVIMPREELRGMQRLLAMAARGDVRLTAMFDMPLSSPEEALPEVAPLVIQPLKIEALVPDSY